MICNLPLEPRKEKEKKKKKGSGTWPFRFIG